MRISAIVLVVVFGLSQAGCPMIDFKEFRFTHQKPEESELIGQWTPTKETLRDIHQRGHYRSDVTPLFVLNPDHTFIMQNIPDWYFEDFGRSHGQFRSVEGTWQLASQKSPWTVWTIRLDGPKGVSWLNIYGLRPPFQIFFRVGDPNEGYAMLFERAKP